MADETVCMTCGRRAADPDATICSDPFHLDAPSRPARDGETLSDEPERDNSIAWLRWWSSPERWKTLGPEHDYKVFGSLRLSDIRNAVAQHECTDRALVDASAELAFLQELAEARGATLAALRAELALRDGMIDSLRADVAHEAAQARALRADLADARAEAARVRKIHLARHTRLSEAVGLDPGYSADATVDRAVELARAARAASGEDASRE